MFLLINQYLTRINICKRERVEGCGRSTTMGQVVNKWRHQVSGCQPIQADPAGRHRPKLAKLTVQSTPFMPV
ncbi:MAG: hypothetical protein ACI831_001830, partial [Candidatus Azotimanducaceae bacterium]